MDHTGRFDGKGEIYAKARPKYAAGLFDSLKQMLELKEGSVFADVGSGTGIFTEQLLERGYRVFAVEPNSDMRRKAEERLSGNRNFVSVNGSDSYMNIPSGSVECVTAAQAFHWFDAAAFRRECQRVLVPGGAVVIVYNSRVEDAGQTRALADLRRRYAPGFHGFSNGISDEACRDFFGGECRVFSTDNTQTYDRRGYVDRALSSSYSLKEGDDGYAEYIGEINAIFDAFAVDGVMDVPTRTVAYVGRV